MFSLRLPPPLRRRFFAALRFTLLSSVLVIAFAALIQLYFEIKHHSDDIIEGVEENALWGVSQLEREALKVHNALQILKQTPADTARLNDLKLQFDILFSRTTTFRAGLHGETMALIEGVPQRFEPIQRHIAEMDPLIFGNLHPLPINQLLSHSDALLKASNELRRFILDIKTEARVERRQKLAKLLQYFGVLCILAAVGATVMLYLLVRHVMNARTSRLRAVNFARQLRRKAHEARAANRAKSQFLSRMSHELRTPLNIILGFGQLLQMDRDELDAEQQEHVTQIVDAGNHLLELINEVLQLSQIEAGVLEVKLQAVDPLPLMQRLTTQIEPLARQRGIRIQIHAPPTPLQLQADPLRLSQVLLNLLSNAIKYNRDGGRVDITLDPSSGSRARLCISDTGPGIPIDLQCRLFRPFERLVPAHEQIEGTGIGLALSKRLVEAMGGEIGVDSEPGDGSLFWFELPITANPIPANEVAEPESAAMTAPDNSIS